MLPRLVFVVAGVAAAYWLLGAFAPLRRRGTWRTLRWVLALALVGSAMGLVPFGR